MEVTSTSKHPLLTFWVQVGQFKSCLGLVFHLPHCAHQRWNVTKYIYSSAVHKYKSEVLVLPLHYVPDASIAFAPALVTTYLSDYLV